MATKTLTVAMVERVRPPAAGHVEYWDTVVPGMLLRVSFAGAKTFQVMTRIGGKRARITIGRAGVVDLVEARERARKIIEDAARGADPRGRPVVGGTTLRAIAADFVERYAKPNTRESTWREYDRLLTRDVLPVLGDRDIADIRRGEVIALLDRIAAGSKDAGRERAPAPYVANRAFAVLSKLFAWCVEKEYVEHSPCANLKRPLIRETKRERALTDAETVAIWTAAGEASPLFRDYTRVLLLCAQRAGEVATMRWSDIDAERGTWTIPPEMTKGGRTHLVPLARQVLDIVRARPRFEDCPFVFTARGDHGFTTLNRLKRELAARATLPNERGRPVPIADWRLHDLRRTAATGMARLGVSYEVVRKVLGHAEPGVTAVYQRYGHDADKRQALQAWADHVERIVAGVTNVVPIRAAESVA